MAKTDETSKLYSGDVTVLINRVHFTYFRTVGCTFGEVSARGDCTRTVAVTSQSLRRMQSAQVPVLFFFSTHSFIGFSTFRKSPDALPHWEHCSQSGLLTPVLESGCSSGWLQISGGCDVAKCHLLWFMTQPLDVAVCRKRIKFIIFLLSGYNEVCVCYLDFKAQSFNLFQKLGKNFHQYST